MKACLHLSTIGARDVLMGSGSKFTRLFLHRGLEVLICKPGGLDRQQPHDRDET